MIATKQKAEPDIWKSLRSCKSRPTNFETAYKSLKVKSSKGQEIMSGLFILANAAILRAVYLNSVESDYKKAYETFLKYVMQKVNSSDATSKSYYWVNMFSHLYLNHAAKYQVQQKIRILLEIAIKSVEYCLFLEKQDGD